jgi:U3 small nucleolar RNA-associated protein 18
MAEALAMELDQNENSSGDDQVMAVGTASDSEKDETEEELERLIFGDSTTFRKQLQSEDTAVLAHAQEKEETGLEGLDDADVGAKLRFS